jgi:hypothetical protein
MSYDLGLDTIPSPIPSPDPDMMMKYLAILFLLISSLAFADARQLDEYQWEGVERIVAIGDIHGDYDNYIATLEAAGLINSRGRWTGGETHLVQTGDIPDRGPDTLKIIEHIKKLKKQAARKGGQVHTLIGNHEAMNVYGDLRYVHEGEYEAFWTSKSEAYRDRYFELYMQSLKEKDPERYANLPENFREQFNLEHPLGWIEHRQAWDPAWNPEGELANWVLGNKVVIRINDTLFLHGGLSGFYCRNTLDSMTEKVLSHLRQFDPADPGILNDDFGPLWYRGLSGVEPQALPETVDAILAKHDAKHIVVGHTPTGGIIWPRYDSKVVQIDTGISRAYGGRVAYLEITREGLFAGYPMGKVKLPESDDGDVAYLEQVIGMYPDNPYLQERLERLTHPAEVESPESEAGEESGEGDEAAPEEARRAPPICGISP